MRSWTGHLLILFAAICIWQGGWIEIKAWLAQGLISHAWERSESIEDRIHPWSWADTWPVARLSVPRLGVERIILAGVSGRTLAFGPGWAEQTMLPGGEGRSVIAGHRDTHFRFVQNLVSGDQLVVQSPDGSETLFRISETAVVQENATWLLEPASDRELLLITCYPFESIVPGGDLRYVVKARAEAVFPQGGKSG